MKYSNCDLVGIADDAMGSIKMAISELEGVEEYKETYNSLKDVLELLQEESEPYEEAYNTECQKEYDYLNSEYEGSVL